MAIELTENYLTNDAEKIAKEFSNKNLDKNQLRKFFDDFKLLERKLNHDFSEDNFKTKILPLIKFTKSKIAYNAGRRVSNKILVPKEFKEYFDKQINNINTIKDFKNFILHYQAIIGYFTYISEYEKENFGGRK